MSYNNVNTALRASLIPQLFKYSSYSSIKEGFDDWPPGMTCIYIYIKYIVFEEGLKNRTNLKGRNNNRTSALKIKYVYYLSLDVDLYRKTNYYTILEQEIYT